MKYTSIILSFVFLLLSCLPCADKEVNDSLQTLVEKSSSEHNQDNDSCSPFCTCNCCSFQSFAFDSTICSFDFIVIKKIVVNKIPEYQSIFNPTYFGSIWQPPQIV